MNRTGATVDSASPVTRPSSAANETRLAIIKAAYHAIARSGAQRVSMQEIADDAGVSKGLIHYHFDHKGALVSEALLWALRATEERVTERLAQGVFSEDPIAGIVSALFVGPDQNRDFYLTYLDVIDQVARFPELESFGEMVHDLFEKRFVTILRRAHASGFIGRDDFENAATDVRLILDGLFIQWLLTPDWRSQHTCFALRCERLLRTVLQDQAHA